MDVDALLATARDTASVRRVFGEPIERDGILVIPVAAVLGGGGGGGRDGGSDQPGEGGGGFGVVARPIGAYVVRDGRVEFRPAIDVPAIVLCAAVLLPRLLRAWTRRRPRADD